MVSEGKSMRTMEWYDTAVATEDELIDRVASLGNGAKFSWSEQDKTEMRATARLIIQNVRRFDDPLKFEDDDAGTIV